MYLCEESQSNPTCLHTTYLPLLTQDEKFINSDSPNIHYNDYFENTFSQFIKYLGSLPDKEKTAKIINA